jgi:hypothetical protein
VNEDTESEESGSHGAVGEHKSNEDEDTVSSGDEPSSSKTGKIISFISWFLMIVYIDAIVVRLT